VVTIYFPLRGYRTLLEPYLQNFFMSKGTNTKTEKRRETRSEHRRWSTQVDGSGDERVSFGNC
jgi:hypothetical protein